MAAVCSILVNASSDLAYLAMTGQTDVGVLGPVRGQSIEDLDALPMAWLFALMPFAFIALAVAIARNPEVPRPVAVAIGFGGALLPIGAMAEVGPTSIVPATVPAVAA